MLASVVASARFMTTGIVLTSVAPVGRDLSLTHASMVNGLLPKETPGAFATWR